MASLLFTCAFPAKPISCPPAANGCGANTTAVSGRVSRNSTASSSAIEITRSIKRGRPEDRHSA
jgi:hypothetical protein